MLARVGSNRNTANRGRMARVGLYILSLYIVCYFIIAFPSFFPSLLLPSCTSPIISLIFSSPASFTPAIFNEQQDHQSECDEETLFQLHVQCDKRKKAYSECSTAREANGLNIDSRKVLQIMPHKLAIRKMPENEHVYIGPIYIACKSESCVRRQHTATTTKRSTKPLSSVSCVYMQVYTVVVNMETCKQIGNRVGQMRA